MNKIPPYGDFELQDGFLPRNEEERLVIGHSGTVLPSQTVSIVDSVQTVNRGFLELLHDPAIILDPYTHKIIYANKPAVTAYQTEQDLFTNITIEKFWTDLDTELSVIEQIIYGRSVNNVLISHLIDGQKVQFNVNAAPVYFDEMRAMLSINKMVSESSVALTGIKQARLEWRDTVDAVSDLIILVDPKGKLRRCNRATIEFFNCSYEELIGSDVSQLLADDTGRSDHLNIKIWEGKLGLKNGWFEISSHEIDIDNEVLKSKVLVVKDVTRRRNAKQELLKLYSVIEQYSDGILITNGEGSIEYVNRAFKTTNKLKTDITGNCVSLIKPELSLSELREEVFPKLTERKIWRQTLKSRRGLDEIFEEVTISPVVDDDGKAMNYVFNLRDVTETRQLESIAEAVNLMENVGYVFSGIRHELGNPINSVKMALTVLYKNYKTWEDDQVNVFISRCLQELGRVEYLLRTLKNFSLHEHPIIEEVGLKSFLDHFISFVSVDFEKRGIEIRIESTVKEETAYCDPRALHQVLMNLLANAADAMEEVDKPVITILLSKGRNRMMLTVSDNGTGMSDKQLTNLFKPFYTSKANGSGLGLVIVRKMMVKMGGTIEIDSELGKGTNVYLGLRTEKQENDA